MDGAPDPIRRAARPGDSVLGFERKFCRHAHAQLRQRPWHQHDCRQALSTRRRSAGVFSQPLQHVKGWIWQCRDASEIPHRLRQCGARQLCGVGSSLSCVCSTRLPEQLLTSYYCPSIAAGKALGRFAVLENVGGFLPTGKIAQQGRGIEWNTTAQMHVSPHGWVDLEDNASLLPRRPLTARRRTFSPGGVLHDSAQGVEAGTCFVVFACGMQIATSSTHYYNHNLITEMRLTY